MEPGHLRWEEFERRLEGPEGCNFRKDENGEIIWDCDDWTHEKPKTRAILSAMGMDVEGSLAYFDEEGGHCDCEVLFNVRPRGKRIIV